MKIIIPTTIKSIDVKKLPIILLDEKGLKISIEGLSAKEKEEIFGIKNFRIKEDGGIQWTPKTSSRQMDDFDLSDYLQGSYKIMIEKNTGNPAEIQDIARELFFIFNIVIGCSFKFYRISDIKDFPGGMFTSRIPHVSRRENEKIDRNKIDRVSGLLKKMRQIKNIKTIDKLKFIELLLETAMSQTTNKGSAGAFYVAILESIFLQDSNAGSRYKFSMRIARHNNENWEYKKKMRDLYDKRSSMFHGAKDDFSEGEIKFLEEEACSAIEKYINNREDFSEENLDRELLNL